MSAWSRSYDLTVSLHYSLLLIDFQPHWPSLFLEPAKLISAGSLWHGCFPAWLPWYAGPVHGSGHSSNVLLRKTSLTTLLKVACFFLTQSLSHHPVVLPEIILFISSLIYNSENELYGRRDLLSLIHCFKLRTSIGPINACFGGELMN